MRRNIGDISKPHFVSTVGGEILLQHIGIRSVRMVLIVVPIRSSGTFCIESHSSHELYAPFSINLDPFIFKRIGNSLCTISSAMLFEYLAYLL